MISLHLECGIMIRSRIEVSDLRCLCKPVSQKRHVCICMSNAVGSINIAQAIWKGRGIWWETGDWPSC